MENDRWVRDKKGELVPFEEDISLDCPEFDSVIFDYNNLLFSEKDETKKEVYKKTIERLENYKKEKSEKVRIKFLPVLNFERQNIIKSKIDGLKRGLNGNIIEDLDADVCANKCLEPKLSYEEWLSTKNPLLKRTISKHIWRCSIPGMDEDNAKKIEELKKKTLLEIQSLNQANK